MDPHVPDLHLFRPLAFVDLETTGLSTLTARVVEVAVLKLRPHDRPETLHTLVNPAVPIPATTTAIHGITDADVAGKPIFNRVAHHEVRRCGSFVAFFVRQDEGVAASVS